MASQPPRRRSSKGQRRPAATSPSARPSPADARSARARAAAERARRRRLLTTVGGAAAFALVAALILIGFNVLGGGDDAADAPIIIPTIEPGAAASPDTTTPTPAAAGSPATTPSQPAGTATTSAAGRSLGDPNAPVKIVEWADYQCPFCGQVAREMEPLLIAEYVDTGKVYYEYRDFAFLGQESLDAAEAAACALDQGRFWEYHTTLFQNQAGENAGAFARDRLVAMAERLGLDAAAFTTCVDGDEHEDEVDAMVAEARAAGVRATPTFIINGTRVEGVADYAELQQYIEDALAGS